MTNELTPQQTFEENIKNRIKADIGNLLPDEVLASLVQKAIHAVLNEKGNYDRMTWVEKQVKESATPKIREFMAEYLSKDKETLKQAITEYLAKEGPSMLASVIVEVLCADSRQVVSDYHYRLTQQLQQKGLGIY